MNKLTALAEEMKYDSSGYAKVILELCALLEKAEEALEMLDYGTRYPQATETLAAIKQWRQT